MALCALCGCSFSAQLDPGSTGPDDPSVDASVPQAGVRRRLTIQANPASDVAELPILVILDASRIEYARTSVGGADLRFVDDNANVLAHEIERWDPDGRSTIWVKVPALHASGTNALWMYYGDPTTTDAQRPREVWTPSYVAVWHLGEAVTDESASGSHVDATGHGHVGAQHHNRGIDDASGIAGVQDFDGNGDYIEVAPAGLSITGTEITLEARALARSEPTEWPHVLGGGTDGRYWQLFWDPGGQGWSNRFSVSGTKVENWTTVGSLNTWATLASVYDGGAVRLYVDGELIQTAPGTGSLDALTTSFTIGANLNLIPRDFDGLIDEVRISNVARPASWLRAQHLSMTDALLAFGDAEPL